MEKGVGLRHSLKQRVVVSAERSQSQVHLVRVQLGETLGDYGQVLLHGVHLLNFCQQLYWVLGADRQVVSQIFD